MAPKHFKMEREGRKKMVNKLKIKRNGAVEEQPSCERKPGGGEVSSCEFRRHLKQKMIDTVG